MEDLHREPPERGPDRSALPDDALVRYQCMAATRAIRGNHRFVLFDDGRLFLAVNDADRPGHRGELFDTALPDEPTTVLDDQAVASVRDLVASTDFASQPAEVAEPARDGEVVVVTARVADGTFHEVTYRNAETALTRALAAIAADLRGDEPTIEELAEYFGVETDP